MPNEDDMSDYVHQAYPKVLYHATEASRIVRDPVEQDELGPEWFESPADVAAGAPAAEKVTKGKKAKD
jgi:hypothetical protein